MKTIRFLLCIFFLSFNLNIASAQSYYPLLEDSTTWDTWYLDNSLFACIAYKTERSFINGDTLINSLVYTKISGYDGVTISPLPCPVWAYDNSTLMDWAILREDTALKKVWAYDENYGQEYLLFDFSLLQGDTFVTYASGSMAFPDTLIVDSTSSVQMLDGSNRKIIFMTFDNGIIFHEYMIEGIGGSAGLYFEPINREMQFSTIPGCVIKSGMPLFPGVMYPVQPYSISCPYLIGNTNIIKGKAYVDLNSNQIYDASDAPLAYKVVSETNTGMFDFTDANGDYMVYVADTGNFSVAGPVLNNFTSVPLVQTANFATFSQIDSLNDFAYQPLSSFDDLEIYLLPFTQFRSGAKGTYLIRVKNTGTTSLSPQVIFRPDQVLQYFSSTQVPTGITTDSVYWNLAPLAPFQIMNYYVVMQVDSGLVPGTPIHSTAEVLPVANDATPTNNFYSANHIITNSFDPNDISVDRDTIFTTELPNPPFLNYLIRFQNTGNDTAFVVRVENNLSIYFDVSTIEFVAASHPLVVHWDHYLNTIEFNFDNILLPDSNVNEPESHGFILYRIKPKTTTPVNTYIYNRASIYFDSNPAVLTNNVYTRVMLPTTVIEVTSIGTSFEAFPNPVDETLTCKRKSGFQKNSKIQIIELSGRILSETIINERETEVSLNLGQLSKGLYLVRLVDKNGSSLKRIVKL